MPATPAFPARYGFAREDVTLANWRLEPYISWAFQNVSEIVPSATIFAGDVDRDPAAFERSTLLGQQVSIAGERTAIDDFLRRSNTDALVVMKDGKFVLDFHAPHHHPRSRHIVFSISKSLTAILAGMLEADGLLDPEAPVTEYVDEVKSSAYASASVRNLLDMTVSLDFEETYLDPESAFARYRRAMLWNPLAPGQAEESLLDFLATMQKGSAPHGGPFRYRSPNSDLLGIVVERASGKRYAELMSERLWMPMGAASDGQVTVDRMGSARAAGGVSMTARDLARVGELMRTGGAGGKRLLSEAWLDDTVRSGGSSEGWQQGDFPYLLPKGRYRNKWYQTGYDSGAFCAIGIHGQWLYVDPSTGVVIVRFSSQPIPVDDPLDLECLELYRAISTMV